MVDDPVDVAKVVPNENNADARLRRRARQRRRWEHLIERVTREAPLAKTEGNVVDPSRKIG